MSINLFEQFINSPWRIGSLELEHRLIQGPLAGYSCAAMRELFSLFKAPAYCVSEMLSAQDVLHKHQPDGRYLFRSPKEYRLCYQLAGNDANTLALAAQRLESLGADLIDLNCGCPKNKIRKKGAGSALLEKPQHLQEIVALIRQRISCPLTVKIRLQDRKQNIDLCQALAELGVDAIIVHGRHWQDSYEVKINYHEIAYIKEAMPIPVIANGDLSNIATLMNMWEQSSCDAFMIARAGTGKPWLYYELLSAKSIGISLAEKHQLFLSHLNSLADIEHEHQALLQGRSLFKYYYRGPFFDKHHQNFYRLSSLAEISDFLLTTY